MRIQTAKRVKPKCMRRPLPPASATSASRMTWQAHARRECTKNPRVPMAVPKTGRNVPVSTRTIVYWRYVHLFHGRVVVALPSVVWCAADARTRRLTDVKSSKRKQVLATIYGHVLGAHVRSAAVGYRTAACKRRRGR